MKHPHIENLWGNLLDNTWFWLVLRNGQLFKVLALNWISLNSFTQLYLNLSQSLLYVVCLIDLCCYNYYSIICDRCSTAWLHECSIFWKRVADIRLWNFLIFLFLNWYDELIIARTSRWCELEYFWGISVSLLECPCWFLFSHNIHLKCRFS